MPATALLPRLILPVAAIVCCIALACHPAQARPVAKPAHRHPVQSVYDIEGDVEGSEDRAVGSFHVGRVQGRSIQCRIRIADDKLVLYFDVRDAHGHKHTLTYEGGWGLNFEVKAGDFLQNGHRQIFLNVQPRRPTITILDCDGTRVREVYSNHHDDNSGAFDPWNAHIVRSVKHPGRWTLVEDQRPQDWNDDGELGLCYELIDSVKPVPFPHRKGGVGGAVIRFLHWNGKEFVPDNPGPTRIVRLTTAAFDRRFPHL